jgi:hypothetical protein
MNQSVLHYALQMFAAFSGNTRTFGASVEAREQVSHTYVRMRGIVIYEGNKKASSNNFCILIH